MGKNMKKIKIISIFISILLLISAISINAYAESNNQLTKRMVGNQRNILEYYPLDIIDLLTSNIHTNCDGFEKTTETYFALTNEINVDGDDNTGINGNDISIQYLIFPWFDMNPDLILGLKFLFNVERIGDEIKNKDFNLLASIGGDIISIGYSTPEEIGNEIPKKISFSIFVFFNTVDGERGLNFNVNPQYESSIDDKKLIFYGKNYNSDENIQREYYFSYVPASESDITITSTRNEGEWHYEINRINDNNVDFTSRIIEIEGGDTKDTIINFYSIPKEISFDLLLTPFSSEGGSFKYQSNTMYDTKILIESNNLGSCKYALINKIPRKIVAQWLPIRENGYYHLEIDSDGTDISLLDSIENPTINLSLNSVEDLNMKAYWNFTNPGDFRIIKDPSLKIDIDVVIGEWEFLMNSKPIAEDIKISWLTDITGYLSYDTNWQPINQMDLLIKGSDVGIRTIADTFKAEDFRLDWTVWPPIEWNIEKSGELDHISLIIEVFINGNWYHLWPWF
jgi:hypothetical protein